jgi:predicted dehydrogenase
LVTPSGDVIVSASKSKQIERRRFLQASAAAAAAVSLASLPSVHADGSDTLRIGLVGCGGRGTGAASNALRADPNLKLVAMGDAFRDKLDGSLAALKRDGAIAQKVDVPQERQFAGFDAYQQVINSGVDVVLLCTPPHFRPAHLDAAVRANKHIFCEKPVAVDAPGVRKVLATSQEAQRRRLCLVSGLCYRYEHAKRATMARVHDGAIGDIVALHTSYNMGALWHRERQPGWSDMEWQMRNWLYFTWLSGDFNVEQHIHSLDKMAWAMRDQYPVRATALGGRQVRTSAVFGNIFDHHATVYEYANGVKCFSYCRQQAGSAVDVSDHIMGTLGKCDVQRHQISGRASWRAPRARNGDIDDMYQNEHNELFAAIRAGRPINNGEYMAKSTLMAIMGRMASYTGQTLTWEQVLNSRQDLTPARYEWGQLPVPPVARPGITEFS